MAFVAHFLCWYRNLCHGADNQILMGSHKLNLHGTNKDLEGVLDELIPGIKKFRIDKEKEHLLAGSRLQN